MKYFISHRGNLQGPDKNQENSPDYVQTALEKGYDVEIDVWFVNDVFYLGHDKPQYQIDESFLKNDKLWCHAKNPRSNYRYDKKTNSLFLASRR